MRPTWDLVWHAIELLRQEPPAPRVARRWERQRDRFTAFHYYMVNGGSPQAKRDKAVRGARRLAEMEQRLASFNAERAYDDPLVIADHRLAGEAFAGTVVASDATRRVRATQKLVPRPLVTVTTADPVGLEKGQQVHDPSRNGQRALITRIEETADGWIIELELQDKMGRGRTPALGSVPTTGDEVVYTALADTFMRRSRDWPTRDDIPWTHGGPPPEYVPVPEDAVEDWS